MAQNYIDLPIFGFSLSYILSLFESFDNLYYIDVSTPTTLDMLVDSDGNTLFGITF